MLREVRLQAAHETYTYYEEDKIGEGGFGSVYRGQEIHSGISVAIKRPHFHSEEALERFKNKDCRYLPLLRHRNIVKVLAILTEVRNEKGNIGPPALIMEYLSGENLQIAWEKQIKLLKVEEKITLFIRICEAVSYAHSKGIVHRDLKPGNILLSSDNIPKIIDFGLAASLQPEELLRLTRSNQFMGSLLYMAPEQQDAKYADKKSDIYALGLILFFIFTGKHARELLLKGEYTLHQVFTRCLTTQIASLCKQACELDKNQRIRSINRLIEYSRKIISDHNEGFHEEKQIQSDDLLLTIAIASSGILFGMSIEQSFYQTKYWPWLWSFIWGCPLFLLLRHRSQWLNSLYSKFTVIAALAVIIGSVLSLLLQGRNMWIYSVLFVSIVAVFYWLRLLYQTIVSYKM